MERKALIVGASGLIGGFCLEALLDDTNYSQVIALVRRPLANQHRKLTQIATQFAELQTVFSQFKVQDIYCCLGTTIKTAGSREKFYQVDFKLVVEIAQASKSRGAEQFLVVSSLGANRTSRIFYNQVKGEMEEAVTSIGFNSTHIFRPSLLTGPRTESRFGENLAQQAAKFLKPLFVGGLKKYEPISAKSVGLSMVKVGAQNIPGKHVYESNFIGAAV